MFYSDLVKKACIISFEAHKNDKDKSGYPYIYHPFYLATQFEDENCVCVALLHDVIEDHGDIYTFESLIDEGFNMQIINALKLLTHDESVSYMDYVREIAKNPIARKVKMADLKHNMDLTRSNGKLPRKIDLYIEAYSFLDTIESDDFDK